MSFTFIQITDHHLRESEALLTCGYSTSWALRCVMRHIAEHAAERADFIVTTGDLVESGSDAEYQAVARMLGLRPAAVPGPHYATFEGLREMPTYFLPGNHDARPAFFSHLFPHSPPADLFNATFEHRGVRFVILDWGPASKAVASRPLLEHLGAALADGAPAIVLMHHHAVPVGARWLDELVADDVARFWEAIAGRNVLGVFCGHAHATYETRIAGVPVFGLRSTSFQFALQDEPLACLLPPHYRVVTVSDGTLATEIVEVPL
jgi:3',5'-cyclic AMP phosphodiesterase CpdA